MSSEQHPIQRYRQSTPTSRQMYEDACSVMPGGNTRDAVYFDPYPIYIKRGDGCYVTDYDGNEYLDFVNNMTSLIHGHAHSGCNDAAKTAINRSSAPGGPTQEEISLATHLTDRVDCIDQIRFTNSGTEATLNAIRAARAYTGNDLIAKFEGIYHGTHDAAQISVHPPSYLSGPVEAPNSVPDSAGIPASTKAEVLTLPFNAVEETTALLEEAISDLAGIILAPFMGSMVIPAEQELLTQVTSIATQHDVPLIVDEVIAFRYAYGGAHAAFDIEPDLIALGKLIGGGFPVGAFGGREDIMAGYDPNGVASIVHSGTFNANPVTTAAGLEALTQYTQEEVDRLNMLGETLATRCRECIADHGVAIQVNQVASLFNMYLTDTDVRSYRDAATSSKQLEQLLFHELLNRGIRLAPKVMGSLSTPMDETAIDEFTKEFDSALEALRPEFAACGLIT